MTVLLVAVNSRFNHINLAVRSLARYVQTYFSQKTEIADSAPSHSPLNIVYNEWTISQPILQILAEINAYKPDAIFFSTYIWNATEIFSIIPELRKICPDVVIGAGGPEVSYQAEKVFSALPALDLIMRGEGEETVLDICRRLCDCERTLASQASCSKKAKSGKTVSSDIRRLFLFQAGTIPGVYSRGHNTARTVMTPITFGGERALITDLGRIPFPYDDGNGKLVSDVDPKNRIIYYESSRGCPFRCSYCLSSIDKTVRFRPLDMVFKELQFFMDTECALVKFVDRTFNLDEERYISIWRYIIEHHNGKTLFHFEIAAQQLSDKALDLLQNVPRGVMQFEIGIQSIHQKTLNEVGRSADMAEITRIVRRIPPTIHVHLDLIAALPHETLKEFGESFNYTISLLPAMLQLGFLKVLSGTVMADYALSHDYKVLSKPPYEVLQTPDFPYSDILVVKQLEQIVDAYYNSGDFFYTMKYILAKLASSESTESTKSTESAKSARCTETPFSFFISLKDYLLSRGLLATPHKTEDFFAYFNDFIQYKVAQTETVQAEPVQTENVEISATADSALKSKLIVEGVMPISELLRFDFIRRAKPGVYPEWYDRRYDKQRHIEALESENSRQKFSSARDAFSATSFDLFKINPETFQPEEISVLFYHDRRDLKRHGKTELVNSKYTIFR